MSKHARALALGSLLLSVLGSCRQVLGIEDAELTPASQTKSPEAGSGGVAASLSELGGEGGVAGETSAAGAGGEGGEGGEAADAALCERYCGVVTSSCTGANAVYTSLANCLAVCAALPPGSPSDWRINSVQCRLQAAQVAITNPAHACPLAGPGGASECGTNCESLCGLREQVCVRGAVPVAKTDPTCVQKCARLKDLRIYSTSVVAAQYGGPHVQCRLYHVSAAASGDAAQHCLHVDGAEPCR